MNTENKEPKETLNQAYDRLQSKYGDLLKKAIIPLNVSETKKTEVLIMSPENDRNICGLFEKHIDQNPDKAREILVQNCILYKKDEMLQNNVAFRAVSALIIDMILTAKGTIKN